MQNDIKKTSYVFLYKYHVILCKKVRATLQSIMRSHVLLCKKAAALLQECDHMYFCARKLQSIDTLIGENINSEIIYTPVHVA